eukprot:11039537-Alexandrium_andersonii.AAC.1
MISLARSRVGFPGVSCAGPQCPGATFKTSAPPLTKKFPGKAAIEVHELAQLPEDAAASQLLLSLE